MELMTPGRPEDRSVVFNRYQDFGKLVAVCSVHFMPLHEIRDFKSSATGAYRTEYKLAAVKNRHDAPSVLIVRDGLERVFIRSDELTRRKEFEDRGESAINIAKDLVRVATGAGPEDMTTDRPAVWISRCSSLPVSKDELAAFANDPTAWPDFAAEVNMMRQRQFQWCERKVKEARGFFQNKIEFNIGSIHRDAANYIELNAAEDPWIRSSSYGSQQPCPMCGAKTSNDAPLCINCHSVINPSLLEKRKAELELAGRIQ